MTQNRRNSIGEKLTPREREIIELLVEGLSNKLIGVELDLSEHTVKFHVTNIMRKLDATSRVVVAVKYVRTSYSKKIDPTAGTVTTH